MNRGNATAAERLAAPADMITGYSRASCDALKSVFNLPGGIGPRWPNSGCGKGRSDHSDIAGLSLWCPIPRQRDCAQCHKDAPTIAAVCNQVGGILAGQGDVALFEAADVRRGAVEQILVEFELRGPIQANRRRMAARATREADTRTRQRTGDRQSVQADWAIVSWCRGRGPCARIIGSERQRWPPQR